MTTSVPRTTAVLVLLLAVTTTACTKVGAEEAEGPEPETTATNVAQEHAQRQPCIPSFEKAVGDNPLAAAIRGEAYREATGRGAGWSIDPGLPLGIPESEWRRLRDLLIRSYVLEPLDSEGQEHQYEVYSAAGDGAPVCLSLTLNPDDDLHGPLLAIKLECRAAPLVSVDDAEVVTTRHYCTREEAERIKNLFFDAHGLPTAQREGRLVPSLYTSVPDTLSEYRWDLDGRRLNLKVASEQTMGWRRADVEDGTRAQDLFEVNALYEAAEARTR